MPDNFGLARDLRLRARDAVFVLLIVAIVVAKLWLVHNLEIAGSATRHDALWFVRSANDWYWWAKYDWTAFVRPPAYPLWLAIVRACDIRQRVAIELLQAAGFLTVALGLVRAGLQRRAALCAFAAMCVHPVSFQLNNYTMADSLYAAMLPLVVGALIFLLVDGGFVIATLSGAGAAVLWCTRAESGMVAALLVMFFVIWITRQRASSGTWTSGISRIAMSAAVCVAVFGVLLFSVYRTNQRTFRGFAKSEMEAPSFTAAFKALVRIRPERVYRFVPVPKESLDRAFAVSPTFGRLRSAFDFESGTAWRLGSLPDTGVQDEIRIDLLFWALRNAAAERGIHSTAKKADRFYGTIARELDTAFADGRLESRWLWTGFVGPNLFREAHHLPHSLRRVLGLFVARYEISAPRDDDDLLPEERALYDKMSLRRPLDSLPQGGMRHAAQAWIGRHHRWFIAGVTALGLVAAAWLALTRGLQWREPIYGALALILFAIVSRVALFTVIDATSWPAAFDRFLFPVMPLASAFLIALISQAARTFAHSEPPA